MMDYPHNEKTWDPGSSIQPSETNTPDDTWRKMSKSTKSDQSNLTTLAANTSTIAAPRQNVSIVVSGTEQPSLVLFSKPMNATTHSKVVQKHLSNRTSSIATYVKQRHSPMAKNGSLTSLLTNQNDLNFAQM